MRALWIVFGLMTACSGMTRGQVLFDSPKESDEYKAAYKQGRAEADRELEDQAATIYTFGLPAQPFESLDRKTGLLYARLGCVFDDKILGLTDGHNDRIMESIKAHGFPKGSFKPWERELFGLKDYVESRRKRDKPETLTADGPALKSPDGPCTIKPFVKQSEGRDGKVVKMLAIELSGDGREPKEIWLFAHTDEKTELFWGPKGSGFAIVATRNSHHDILEAVDMRRRRRLRMEMISRPERPETRPKDWADSH